MQERGGVLAHHEGVDLAHAPDEADRGGGAADHLVHDERAAELSRVEELQERLDAAPLLAGDDHAVHGGDGRRLAAREEALHLRDEVALVEGADDALALEALHEDRGHRPHGADVFARAAADARGLVDDGDARDNRDRLDRALALARRAGDVLRRAQAAVLLPDRVAHVEVAPRNVVEKPERARRARRRALLRAGEAAVAPPEVHLRLAERLERRRGDEALLGARRDARAAADAQPVEERAVNRAGRQDLGGTRGDARKGHGRVAAVRRLLHDLRRREEADARHELAPRHAARRVAGLRLGGWRRGEAPAAGAAPLLQVNRVRITRLLRKQVKERPHRTDPVAPGASRTDDREDQHAAREDESWRKADQGLADDRIGREGPAERAEPRRDESRRKREDAPADDPLDARLGEARADAADV